MRVPALAVIFLSAACSAASFNAHYLSSGPATTAMAAAPSGNLYVASTLTDASGNTQLRVTALDPTGAEQSHFDFSLGDRPTVAALAVDPQLNVIAAGNMDSGGFLVRFDSALTSILGAVTLPGVPIYAMTLDSSGNIYVGGNGGAGAAVTPGAYQTTSPGRGAYLAKFSPALQISDGTFFEGGAGYTNIGVMALDSSGNIVVAGSTTDNDLPITAGVIATQCNCGGRQSAAFAAKFSSSLSSLIWSTFIPYPSGINSLALDQTGNVLLAGSSNLGFPVSSKALQTVYPGEGNENPGGLLLKLDSTASQLIFATYFGGYTPLTGPIGDPPDAGPEASVNSVFVDASNTIWITGYSSNLGFPGPILGPTYIADVSPDGSSLLSLVTAPEGAAGVQILAEPSGTIVALGNQGSVLLSTSSGPSIVGIANAAGPAVSPSISPVEIVSIYGYNLGPSTPLSAQVSGGVVSHELGGYSVLFNGMPAPLLYVGPNQINCIVPYNGAPGFSASVQLVTPQGTVNGATLSVVQAQPAIFYSGDGYASALNQDGTVNSASNPAPKGSIVSLFATGLAPTAHSTDGLIVPPSQIVLSKPLSVSSYGLPIEVDYSGDAPDQVWGVAQLNIRVPYSGTFGLYIQTASATSPAVLIYASN
jgi:uncharacterized protein (TIGR03437 family)